MLENLKNIVNIVFGLGSTLAIAYWINEWDGVWWALGISIVFVLFCMFASDLPSKKEITITEDGKSTTYQEKK